MFEEDLYGLSSSFAQVTDYNSFTYNKLLLFSPFYHSFRKLKYRRYHQICELRLLNLRTDHKFGDTYLLFR